MPPPNQPPQPPQQPHQWGQPVTGPPPAAWGQPVAAAPEPTLDVAGHIRRALSWRLERVEATPGEASHLAADGVLDPALQGYAAWRRSVLLLVLPVVGLTAVLGLVDLAKVETDPPLTDLFVIAQVLPLLAPSLLAVGVFLAFRSWTKLASSSRILTICWILSVALPLLPALLPADWLVDRATFEAQTGDVEFVNQVMSALRVELGVGYAVALLPVLVTVPGGVVRGSARVKGLLPAATLPGFFLVTTAPFYSLIVLVSLVLLIQLTGTGLLTVGALVLAVSPWVYVQQRRHYLGAVFDDESSAALDRAQKVNGLLTLAGVACVLVWALTAKVNGVKILGTDDAAYFDMLTVSRTVVEVLARSYATTVVFAHIFLTLTVSAWRTSRQVAGDPRLAAAEQRNAAISHALGQ